MTDANKLRDTLARLGLSQRGLARELEIDERTVRRWCAGDSDVPTVVWMALELPGYKAALARAKAILAGNLAHEPPCKGEPCTCGHAVIMSQLDPTLPESGIRFPSPSGDWGTITHSNFGPIEKPVEIRSQPATIWVCSCGTRNPLDADECEFCRLPKST